MTDHPHTREAMERWRQGKINVFDALAELEDQRDEALAEAAKWERLHDEDTDHLTFLQVRDNMGPTETLNQTAQRLQRERDQWRECAERLAKDLGEELAENCTTDALQEFHQLTEDSK